MTDPRITAVLATLAQLERPAAQAGVEALGQLQSARDQVEALAAAITPLKLSGDPTLDALIRKRSAEFESIRDSLPKAYWARYDISAVRLGFELARREATVVEQPAPAAAEV